MHRFLLLPLLLLGLAASAQTTPAPDNARTDFVRPATDSLGHIICANPLPVHQQPVWVIDGQVQAKLQPDTAVDSEQIASLKLLRKRAAIARYGDVGRNGAIVIETKRLRSSK